MGSEANEQISIDANDVIHSLQTQMGELSARHSLETAQRDALIKKLDRENTDLKSKIDSLANKKEE